MSDIILGQLITGPAERDAIHIAVAPVVAGCKLSPGEEVGFLEDGTAGAVEKPVGIVDPFLKSMVNKGEKFYLVLFQNTVTGMRHHWLHPAFADTHSAEKSITAEDRITSELWLRKFIAESNCPDYETVIAAATGQALENTDPEYYDVAYRNDGEYLHFNGRDAHGNIPPEFWNHIEIVTGVKIPREDRAESWSCSC